MCKDCNSKLGCKNTVCLLAIAFSLIFVLVSVGTRDERLKRFYMALSGFSLGQFFFELLTKSEEETEEDE